MTTDAAVDRARDLFEQRSWGEAYAALRAADSTRQLASADVERLAVAAYLTGRDDEACDTWARAHRQYLRDEDGLGAVRCAYWLGCVLILRGQMAPAHGWVARIKHLVEQSPCGPVAAGYLDLAAGLVTMFSGDPVAARPRLESAALAGLRHADADLAAISRLGCGQTLVMTGEVADGLAMLDEAMVSVTAGDVSPVATGLIYCAVIETCQGLFDLRRAQEWTHALGSWCDAQPDLVPYRGQCLVHRAELMRFHGAWNAALGEAEQAARRLSEPVHPALGAAFYEQAELHRLRGDDRAAGDLYRRASDAGHGAQPGLALLRLRQGQLMSAAAAIDRALGEHHFPAERARLLIARVEVLLAGGDVDAARAAVLELSDLCDELGTPPMIEAMSLDASGAVLLAGSDPQAALRSLRPAWSIWQEVGAPYEAARTRLQIGVACRDLGDQEAAAMEFAAARHAFVDLGAVPEVARVDALSSKPSPPGGLTSRELEVLVLVASGATNKAIAAELVISEKTVARHVSNIFVKIRVSSRAAATAYAYEHELMY
ncbi:MAG TPA: LuxR C-terminal-related transcriptional regulator [Desertimonas sp.]|nr:LuxR C-terminal-related transcriptional regulator [Desertimonas sp.]